MLTNEEYESLAENYKIGSNILKVKKSFETSEKLSDGKPAIGVIRGFTRGRVYSSESFYGAHNVQNGKLGEIIYIPASNEVNEFTKLSGPSALRDLISKILTGVINDSDTYNELRSSIDKFSFQIKESKSKNKQSLNIFEEELNKMLLPWGSSFQLRIETPPISDIIKSMTKYYLIDNYLGCEQDIENYGSGFQRHFIYSLITSGNKYLIDHNSSEKKEFIPNLSLLLFEEPEAFLHPSQQIKLARDLMAMAINRDWQILCSTHSPNFVSKAVENIPSIIHFEKNNGITTHQISKGGWESICDSNNVIFDSTDKNSNPLDKLLEEDSSEEMNWIKYFLCLNPDRASAFFSELVLLVEGPSEVNLINKLIDDEEVSAFNNIYVFDCIGKFNIHLFMNLFGALGIKHSVLFDLDGNKNDQHKMINSLINKNGNSYTRKIKGLPIDLETSLGVEKPKESYKKPQHLMYLYINQKIDEEKLNNFIKIIQELIDDEI